MAETIAFYVLSTLILVFAGLVIANPLSRNPVTSAMFLVLTIGALAGLFVLLHAFFLAAVQVLVYAGAVMVLFLFVIMLLDLKEESRRKIRRAGVVMAVIAVGTLVAVLVSAIARSGVGANLNPQVQGETVPLGTALFSKFVLPFEIVSVLLLVAMVGVILLSKKDLK